MNKSARILLLSATLLGSAGGVGAGFWKAMQYENTPGQKAAAVTQWPAACSLARDPQKATLIVAVHPECPCSRASMDELAQLMTHCRESLQTYVLFSKGSGADPRSSGLWQQAALTGVTRVVDDRNMASRLFGARTSGQVMLFDTQGQLRFSGGITASRGHDGDNDGLSAIETYLNTGKLPVGQTPVYGCALE